MASSLLRIDESHARLQLGSHEVTLDIPVDQRASYDPEEAVEAPNVSIELDWVYGYRGRDCRNNLFFVKATNEIVYFSAAVVILFDINQRRQRHYMEHNDDVRCIALHPEETFIASGQVAGHHKTEGKPHVRIWRSDNLMTLHVIGIGEFQRAVCCVCFSVVDGGDKLCVVDEAENHILSVWDWKRERQIAESRSSKEPVLDIEFHPRQSNTLVCCGKGQITFWTITDSRQLIGKRGIFQPKESEDYLERNIPKYILCLAFSPSGDLLSGDSNGTIFVWGKGKPKITRAMVEAHDESVFSINFLSDGRMISGGQGGQVKLWDSNYKRLLDTIQVDDFYGPVRCITGANLNATTKDGPPSQIIVGTTKNCLLEGSFQHGFVPLVQGHRDEIWGLDDNHGDETRYVTGANDRRVFMWDGESRRPVWRSQISQPPHCVAMTQDGGLIAVGTQTGHWFILEGLTGTEKIAQRTSRRQIECIAFSPVNSHLAFGSHDNMIYIFDVGDSEAKLLGKLTGHTSYVSHLDWSADGNYLRSNSGDYEILYWKTDGFTREYSDDVTQSLTWASHSCTLNFNVAGIWQDANDGTDVNAVTVDTERNLVISGDDFGNVKVYRYPCYSFGAKSIICKGHSSHVTNVKVVKNSNMLISTGGRDMTVFQWRIITD